jgi:hypothetical protein
MKPKWDIEYDDDEYQRPIIVYADEVKSISVTQIEADGVVIDFGVGHFVSITKL